MVEPMGFMDMFILLIMLLLTRYVVSKLLNNIITWHQDNKSLAADAIIVKEKIVGKEKQRIFILLTCIHFY